MGTTFLDVVARLRFKVRRRLKARKRQPLVLTWEQIDKDAEAELLEQAQEEAEEAISELEQSLRMLN